ncbi:MAG: ferric reductase-like transmembrane domain-containing protein [Candidatus Magasanikbacteria bacterium]|jgi:predicted ferric reductase
MTTNIQLTTLLYDLGKWAGLVGFFCLTLLITSGDTARFFDRYFGMDKIIKFQRKFALITTFFVVLHPIFFILSSKSILRFIIPNFAVMPLALGIIAFYIFLVVGAASHFYKKISYNYWQIIHVLNYLLFFASLFHAFNWGSDSENILVRILYILSLIAIVMSAIYRTQYKLRKRWGGKFIVENIIQETKDTFTIVVKPEKKLNFKAGQFCFLRINKNKLHARHPFSMSSAPQDHNLQFTIKMAGRFTDTASKINKGDEILTDGPFGRFIEKGDKKNLVFIAGGVGITPFMSIIRDHVIQNNPRKITLLYGSKTTEDVIFKNELNNIKNDWFKVVHVLSEDQTTPAPYEHGRIDENLIKKYISNFSNSLFYICGPEEMKSSVIQTLLNNGVDKKDIIFEDFFW